MGQDPPPFMLLDTTVGDVMAMIQTLQTARKVIGDQLTGQTTAPINLPQLLSPNADYHFIKIEEILRSLKIDQNQ